MTGGSRAHQRIVMNLTLALMRAIDPAAFDAVQAMRMQMPGGAVRYPDVAVVAGAIAPAVKTLTNAVVICEVLSPDTAEADRGEKFAAVADTLNLPEIGTTLTLSDIYVGVSFGG
jgi:Uma2 family endonuclease